MQTVQQKTTSTSKEIQPFLSPSDSRDMNLVNMILNIESNNSNNYQKPLDVYNVYINMAEINANKDFRDSLQNSKECVKIPPMTNGKLSQLKANDPNSFLVLPLLGKGHLWSTLIRKTDEGYNAFVVNKGLRYWHDPLEEFVFKPNNQKGLVDVLKYSGAFTMNNIEDVYRKFISKSDSQYNLTVDSSKQKVGNCFTKNIQAGIKLAYSTRNTSPEKMRTLRLNQEYTSFGTKPATRTTFKWDTMSTEDMQKLYVNKIIEKNPKIAQHAANSIDIYTSNKHFREMLKASKNPVEAFVAAFDPQNSTKQLPHNERVKLLLKDLTPYTFGANKNEVDKVVMSTKDNEYIKSYKYMNNYSYVGKENMGSLYFQFFMEAKHDPIKSLEAIFDKEGKMKNMTDKEKLPVLMSHLNPFVISLHRNPLKASLAKVFGQENVTEHYNDIYEKAKIHVAQVNDLTPPREEMQKVSANFPIIVGQVNHRISELYTTMASDFLNKNNNATQAMSLVNKSQLFESNYENTLLKAECYAKVGETAPAIREYTKAINIDQNQYRAYLGRAKAYERSNNKLAAKLDYEKAITINPELKKELQKDTGLQKMSM